MRISGGLALGTALCLLAGGAGAQERDRTPGIAVTGTGTVEREPNRAVLVLAVETQAATARDAARMNAERANAVIAALRRAGLRENRIRTLDYNLHPDYRHDPGRDEPRLVGYRAINRIEAVIDSIGTVGAIIDAAIAAGANRVDNLQFGLSNAESARREALAAAVTDARANAEVLARAAGVRLGAPLHISMAYDPVVPLQARQEALMRGFDAAMPTPVETGALTIRATVSVIYRLE